MTREEKQRLKSEKRRAKRANKKRHVVSNILLLIAIGVFCFAAFKIVAGEREYKKGRDEYKKIREAAKPPEEAEDQDKIDWDTLKNINPDVVAWIKFDQPKTIDYPVVQGKDNDIYLKKSFGENYIKAGTIFVNCDNAKDFTDPNTFVYGHNMNDGSMFAKLKKYEDKSFYDKYPNFYIYTTDDVKHKYRIFAAGTYDVGSDAGTQYQFEDEKDFTDFIAEIKKGAYYETGVNPGPQDRIVTLYTCTNVRDQDRRLVFGVEETE